MTTLALWYRPTADRREPSPPRVEVHVNLWRRERGKNNLLDLGIRFEKPDSIENVAFFIPIRPSWCDYRDLSSALRDQQTLSAVFNELLQIGASQDDHFVATQNNDPYMTIHRLSMPDDISIGDVSAPSTPGMLLTLNKRLCKKLTGDANHYLRFRLILKREGAARFTSDTSSEDGPILSSIIRSEVTEFRLNEARSIPSHIRKLKEVNEWCDPIIHSIKYFLVRDLAFDLIASHVAVHKIRRLEPIWNKYLGNDLNDPDFWEKISHASKTATLFFFSCCRKVRRLTPFTQEHRQNFLASAYAHSMIIYHWKVAEDQGVEDLVTLAKFRRSLNNILVYLLLVVILGAAGSALQAYLLETTASALGTLGIISAVALIAVMIVIAKHKFSSANSELIESE